MLSYKWNIQIINWEYNEIRDREEKQRRGKGERGIFDKHREENKKSKSRFDNVLEIFFQSYPR
jgi:hypothetical protein